MRIITGAARALALMLAAALAAPPALAASLSFGVSALLPVTLNTAPATVTVDTVIGFDQLAGPNGAAFTGLTQEGYVLTALGGAWRERLQGVAGVPALAARLPRGGAAQVLEIARADGAAFTLLSFDFADAFGAALEVRSWLPGGGVNSIGTSLSLGGTWSDRNLAAGAVDRLSISLTGSVAGGAATLDTIRLRQVLPVPEPGSLPLLAGGLLALVLGLARPAGAPAPRT